MVDPNSETITDDMLGGDIGVAERRRMQKQNYLHQNIVLKQYDTVAFAEYMQSMKGKLHHPTNRYRRWHEH